MAVPAVSGDGSTLLAVASAPPDIPLNWRNPDPIVERIVQLLERGERTVPYWWLTNADRFGGRFANPRLAYAYWLVWTSILLAALVSSGYWLDAGTVVTTFVVVGVTYRLWDIVRWWTDFLIDRRHFAVLSRERNVVFLALNLIELTIVALFS